MSGSYEYTDQFYDYIERGARRSAKAIVPLVFDVLHPCSVLDFGCGRGVWVREWLRAGASTVLGVDGTYVDLRNLTVPPEMFCAADLSKSFDFGRRFDLVQSLEVAEHIPESCADIFIQSICCHGDICLFSAAVPGQGGEMHVNEQPLEYWRKKFGAQGFEPFDWLRPQLREAYGVEPWYRYNILLYVRLERISSLPSAVRETWIKPTQPIVEVAPVSWRMRNAVLRRLPVHYVDRLAKLKHKAFLTFSVR